MKNFIAKYSKTRNIVFLFLLFLIFNLFLFPKFMTHENPLDLSFNYTGQEAYSMIEGYGETVREDYLNALILLDFIYPIIYSFLFSFVLFRIYHNKSVILFPFLILLADYMENTGTLIMLTQYPEPLFMVGNISGIFTTLKWLLLIVLIIFFLVGLAKRFCIYQKPNIPGAVSGK